MTEVREREAEDDRQFAAAAMRAQDVALCGERRSESAWVWGAANSRRNGN
jgi:hypothetical protein